METVNKMTGEITEVEPLNKLSTYNQEGQEVPDPRPLVLPVGFERPLPIGERIRRLVHDELLQRELDGKGVETFDDADDFDVPEDPTDRSTPYEENFDPLHTTAREQEIRAGFVQELPAELKSKAKDVIAKHTRTKDKSDSDSKKADKLVGGEDNAKR